MSAERGCKVLIAMDGSEYGNYAFDWYLDSMHRPGNEVVIAHCSDYTGIINTPGIRRDPALAAEMIREEAVKISRIIDKLRERFTKTGVPGRILRLIGHPGSTLVAASEEEKVDYIVTGTRGLGMIRRTLMGSVSDYIVHHAHVPVIVCPKDKKGHSK